MTPIGRKSTLWYFLRPPCTCTAGTWPACSGTASRFSRTLDVAPDYRVEIVCLAEVHIKQRRSRPMRSKGAEVLKWNGLPAVRGGSLSLWTLSILPPAHAATLRRCPSPIAPVIGWLAFAGTPPTSHGER